MKLRNYQKIVLLPAKRIILICALLMIFAGCVTVGPDYKNPDLSGQYHENWIGRPKKGGTTSLVSSAPIATWWRQFGDDELETLVTKLLESNLNLAQARERIVEARAGRGIVNADKLPQIDLEAGMRRAGTGDDALSFQGPPQGEEVNVFSAGALAGWEVDLWGRVSRLVEAADRDIDTQYENYNYAMVSLTAELSLGYIDARALEERLRVLDHNIDLLKKILALSQVRLKAGSGTQFDVLQARQRLDQTRAKRPELVKAKAVAYHRIAVLIGGPPSKNVIGQGHLPQPPDMVGVGLPADLITRRADVRRSEMQYAAAVARIGAAAAQKYPRLSLSGSLTFQTDTAGGLFDTDAMIYSLGPSLSFPLFDGGRIDRTVRVRQSQADQARLILRQTLLEAVKDVEDAAAGVMQNQQRVAHLTATVNYAGQRVKLAERLYKTGLGSLTQLIDAQHELVDINDSLVVARQTELGGIVALYRSLGGGWDSVSLGQTSYVANKGGIEK